MKPNILDIFFKAARKDIKKKFLAGAFEAVLNIFVKGALTFVMGPISLIIPYTRIASWFFEWGVDTNDELESIKYRDTEYDVRRTDSGLLIAENKKPLLDLNTDLLLPNYYESSLKRFNNIPSFNYKTYNSIDSFRKDFSYIDLDTNTCHECGSILPLHKDSCSKSYKNLPIFDITKCSECGYTGYQHSFSCSKNPINKIKINTCDECGHVLPLHYDSCSKSYKIFPTFDITKCSECGETGYKHSYSCSQNPINKIKINTCNECGHVLPLHYDSCSKSFYNISKFNITKCSECGEILPKHKYSCSKWTYKFWDNDDK